MLLECVFVVRTCDIYLATSDSPVIQYNCSIGNIDEYHCLAQVGKPMALFKITIKFNIFSCFIKLYTFYICVHNNLTIELYFIYCVSVLYICYVNRHDFWEKR